MKHQSFIPVPVITGWNHRACRHLLVCSTSSEEHKITIDSAIEALPRPCFSKEYFLISHVGEFLKTKMGGELGVLLEHSQLFLLRS